VWAADVEFSGSGVSVLFHLENYYWQSGNAAIGVEYTVSKQSFNADLVKQAVAKQDFAASDALKGVRQRTSAPSTTTNRPASNPTPAPSSSKNPSVTGLETASSHRFAIKVDTTGPDYLDMQSLVDLAQWIRWSCTTCGGSDFGGNDGRLFEARQEPDEGYEWRQLIYHNDRGDAAVDPLRHKA